MLVSGGGGGSGYKTIDGGTLTTGNGAKPGGVTDVDYADSGAGYGTVGNGKNGRGVVRLGKP